jgi:hypothetical protein
VLGYYCQNGLLSGMTLQRNDTVIFYSKTPQLFILKSGLLVISSALLDTTLVVGGADLLSYLIAHEISHLA